MRKLLCFAFVFLSAFAFGQTTAVITGNLVDQSETGTSSGTSVDVTLVNTGSQRCFVNGTGTVVTEKKNYTAAQILAGITLAKTANITCGASSGQTRWRFSFKNSALNTSRDCDLQISGATSLNTATCLQATTTPTTTVPTSSLYLLLDGSNSMTGNLVPAVNGTQSVGTSGSRWSMFAATMDVSGNGVVGGTLGVTGAATAASVGDSTGTPATAGFVRLQSTDQICWRNNANGANVCIAKTGAVGAIPADSLDNSGFPSVKEPEAIFSGPNPYYDPRVAGAKCDGTTDDTSAFNTAISAANSGGGGWVLVPAGKTCVIAGQINEAQMKGVRLASTTGVATFNTPLPILKFTGTTSPLVDARSSQGLEFDHFTLQYTNAAFAGRVLDFEHVIASDSQNFRVHDMTITGTSTAKGAICLVCADQTDVGSIDGVSFFWALHAVEALNANIFRVSNSNFASGNPGVGDITGDYITDLGNNSTIGPNDNFEMSTNVSAIHCSTCGNNINIFQDTGNDFVAGFSAILFNINSSLVNVQDNFIGVGPGGTATFFSGAGAQGTFNLCCNSLGNWGTPWIGLNGPAKSVNISNNGYGTITTFLNICCPTSGTIQDNQGVTRTYGVNLSVSNTARLTGDFTDANAAGLQVITGLSLAIPATTASVTNTAVSFHCGIQYSQATPSAGDQFGVASLTTAPSQLRAWANVITTEGAAAAQTTGDSGAITTTTPTAIVTFTPVGVGIKQVSIDGSLETSGSGTSNLQFYVTNGTAANVVVIKRDSYCTIF